ncbi:hypothetical protein B6O77_004542 [Salmonella enterica subsp. enterica serovar Mississippi]|nr:hypothetical protein [Salmonella enterica subsp. enterica serovar Mississippi]
MLFPWDDDQDNKEKKITSISWSYGEEQTELSDISRHYVDLNLHIRTEGYVSGESVSCQIAYSDFDNNEKELTVSGEVNSEGNVFIENVFSGIDVLTYFDE